MTGFPKWVMLARGEKIPAGAKPHPVISRQDLQESDTTGKTGGL
jgi:hypothetical protein